MSVLVTGGAGYIGSHTCVSLLNRGMDVIILDDFSNSNQEVVQRIEHMTKKEVKYYSIDLKEKDAVHSVFAENEIEAVIHFAGYKAVGESVVNPLSYYDNNLISTIYLLQVMKQFNVKKLVFSSSATVYGRPKQVPIAENAHLSATNPYGRTKLIIEDMLRDIFASDNEWAITCLRYFNPIGAHPSGNLGEDPRGIPNNLMPYITQVAIGKRPVLQIFGDGFSTKDGTGVRDYIHVMDLAEGHICALEQLKKETGFNFYNLGTGKGYSVLEIVQTFERVNHVNIPYIITDARMGDIPISYADPTAAATGLGWKAQRGLEEMCIDAWRWQKNNPAGYSDKKNPHLMQSGDFSFS